MVAIRCCRPVPAARALATLYQSLSDGDTVLIDGATGTELERRGAAMYEGAWCAMATETHPDVLRSVHEDYIAAGARVITANTYASSRLMLAAAGCADRFADINRAAVHTAQRAREASGQSGILVAGSLSHMVPMASGTARPDLARAPGEAEMAKAFGDLASLLEEEACELILLEMMYHPDRMPAAFTAATATGLPVWAGFSARRGKGGRVLSFAPDKDIPFEEIVQVLADFEIAAAGVMHTPSDVTGDAIAIFSGLDAIGL